MKVARFLQDDPQGLWRAGDEVEDMGPESPAMPMLRLLRKLNTGELITLTRPYERNLIEEVRSDPVSDG